MHDYILSLRRNYTEQMTRKIVQALCNGGKPIHPFPDVYTQNQNICKVDNGSVYRHCLMVRLCW